MGDSQAEAVLSAIDRILTGDVEHYQIEYACHSHNQQRWFILRLTRFENQENVYVVTSHENITERKQKELCLQTVEKRFQDMVMCSSDWVWEVNQQGAYTYVSGNVKEILGYEPDELLGKTPFDLMTQEERDHIYPLYLNLSAKKEDIVNLENWAVTKHGRHICLSTNGIPYYDSHGHFSGYRGVDRDITKEKLAQNRLEKSEKIHHATQRVAKIGGWEFDLVSQSLYWTDEVRRIHEVPIDYQPNLEDAIGFYTPKHRAIMQDAIDRAIETGAGWDLELQLITATKKTIWVRAIGHAERKEGNIVTLYGTFQDIDETKRTEYSLIQSQKNLDLKNQIATAFLTNKNEDVYAEALSILLQSFDSEYGYFGYINEKGELVCPSMTRDIWDACQVPEKSIVFPPSVWGGLWGRSLTEKKSMYQNQSLTLPKGHIALSCAIAIPILFQESLIGHIVLANKPGGYNNTDVNQLNTLVDQISPDFTSAIGSGTK